MAIANLEAIINKVRKLTASSNANQLKDEAIIDYVNSFYLYDFPAEFRSLDLKDIYTFNTTKGIDTYPFDRDHWINIQEPAYVAKREVRLFTDPLQFYYFNFNSNPHWQKEETIGTGDAVTTSFSATLQNTPILRSVNNNPFVTTTLSTTNVQSPSNFPPTFPNSNVSRLQNILVTANISNGSTLNLTDDGAGILIDENSVNRGSIDYETGAVTVNFSSAPGDGEFVIVLYNPVVLNIPLAIMMFQNQMVLRPVPDKGYTVEIVGYRLPSQVIMGTTSSTSPNLSGRPEEKEWWECIAVGAAKKVYEDRLDMDGVATMDKMLQERYQTAYTRTYATLGTKRIGTIYSDQLEFTSGAGPFGVGNYS